MKFRTFALFAAAAAAVAAWKVSRERRRDAEITMELSGDAYQPAADESEGEAEASAAETTAETTAEAADQPEEEPLAAGVDLTEAEEEWAEEPPRKKMDPFAIADAADFSGDWEDIDCKG